MTSELHSKNTNLGRVDQSSFLTQTIVYSFRENWTFFCSLLKVLNFFVSSFLWSGLSHDNLDEEIEDEEGRLERRIIAPWEKDLEGDEENDGERKVNKTEERRKRKSVKLRSKEKIGNIDINILQRELCK